MPPPLHLLVIDDDVVDRLAIRRHLATADVAAEIVEAGDAGEGLRRLADGGFDAVLLDHHLPGDSGLTVLARAAKRTDAPIIVLTGQADKQVVVDCMKTGAADYLDKHGLDPRRLATSLRNAVAARAALRQAREAEAALGASQRLERGLVACARTLLAAPTPAPGQPRALNTALRHLLEATDQSRIVCFAHRDDADEGLVMEPVALAYRLGTPPVVAATAYRHGFRRWQNDLGCGETVSGVVELLPGEECLPLAAAGVRSVLAVPIHIGDRWAGVLRVDDCLRPHRWLKEEIRLLRAGAEMIGTWLGHGETMAGHGSHVLSRSG